MESGSKVLRSSGAARVRQRCYEKGDEITVNFFLEAVIVAVLGISGVTGVLNHGFGIGEGGTNDG